MTQKEDIKLGDRVRSLMRSWMEVVMAGSLPKCLVYMHEIFK